MARYVLKWSSPRPRECEVSPPMRRGRPSSVPTETSLRSTCSTSRWRAVCNDCCFSLESENGLAEGVEADACVPMKGDLAQGVEGTQRMDLASYLVETCNIPFDNCDDWAAMDMCILDNAALPKRGEIVANDASCSLAINTDPAASRISTFLFIHRRCCCCRPAVRCKREVYKQVRARIIYGKSHDKSSRDLERCPNSLNAAAPKSSVEVHSSGRRQRMGRGI